MRLPRVSLRVLASLIGVVCLAAFATWVWPTLYRPIRLDRPMGWMYAARENRFTGSVDVLARGGWYRLGPDSGYVGR